MKKLILFAVLVSFSMLALAMQTIRGKVVDASNQQALDFVNVSLINENSQEPAAGVVSDASGKFELPNVPVGKYTLKLSFMGYNTLQIPLRVDNKALDMGMIKLSEDSKSLSELEVVGQGSQMRFDIDKKVFTVDQNIAAGGGAATDVLQNIPSVEVDNEGNVALRNSSNVEVWINGKPSGLTAENRAQILQQMPAENIEQIEIMTNPSAKFSPEGTSGIINIVLKKNRKAGYFGSVSAGSFYAQGAKPGYMSGVNINYSSSKLDAYLNVGYRQMKFAGGGWMDRYSLVDADTISLLHSDIQMSRQFQGVFTRAGLDYHLNDHHTLSLSGFTMNGSAVFNSNYDYLLTDYPSSAVLRDYTRNNSGTGTRPHLHLTLGYKYDIDDLGSNLMVDLNYSTHTRSWDENYLQKDKLTFDSTLMNQMGQGTDKEYEFKLDYTKKFSEKSKLEAGWYSVFENRFGPSEAYDILMDQPLNNFYNEFVYEEQIHAGYLTYGTAIDKFTFQGGLRGEYFLKTPTNTYYNSLGNLVTDYYDTQKDFQLFPTLFISYSLPNNNELQMNVTRRVNRPRGRQINPFRNFSDSTNISYGNLELRSEYTSAYELNYLKTWDMHTLSATLYHRYTDDVIQDVRYLNGNTMENTFMNVTKSENSGLELVAKNRLFKVLNLTSSLNMYYGSMDSAVYVNPYNTVMQTIIPARESFSWTARVMANIMFGKNTSGQITADYASPRVIAQGTETASYAVDLGLRQTFLNKSLSASLMVRDLFNTRSRSNITWGDGFYQKSEFYFHSRMIGLTLSYNFGNMKPKKREGQTTSEGSEMNFEE